LLFLEFRQIHLQFRVAIFPQKIILQNTEQTETLIHRLFYGMETARNSFQSHSARNSVAHHFTEEKNARNFEFSLRTIPKEDLNSRHSIPNHFAEEKNTRDFVPTPYAKKLLLEIVLKENTVSFTFSAE
jgi:hypothetical protein